MLVSKYSYESISRTTVEGKRYYCLPDGNRVASVTSILDATKSEESRAALQNWRRSVGVQKAQEITTEASSRGTRMHKWLETYIKTGDLGQPGSNPYSQQSYKMAQNIIDQGLKNVHEFYGVEVNLYYPGLYAGTTDCCANWKGQLAILDFKQTNKLKKREWIEDYFLQLVAYSLAHNKIYNTDIQQGVILMCSANYEYQEFRLENHEFEKYTDKWFQRLEQYYQINNR